MSHLHYIRFLSRYLNLLAFKRKTIGGTMERMAARHGAAVFCQFENERISFDAFNRRANRRAQVFRALGVGKGDVVCLLMENRPEYLETVVGLSKLGAVTALVNSNLRHTPLLHSINLARTPRLIVGAECLEALDEVRAHLEQVRPETTYVDTRWPEERQLAPGTHDLNEMLAAAAEDNPPSVGLNSSDPALYIYTSGTTGLPKAARITHYRWYAAGLVMGYYGMHIMPADIVYCPLPLYHSNGVLIAFGSALVNGAGIALTRRFSASRFWQEVQGHGATAIIYIGELLRYLVNAPPGPYDKAHKVTRILGNGLRPDIWETFQERFDIPHIREFYASTEGNAVTVNTNDVPGSVGTPVLKTSDNTAVVRYDVERDEYVRDAQGHCVPCQPGEAGELLGKIQFTTPFHGYTSDKDTEGKILRNVFRKGDAYFRTGDLVRRDEQGNYFFVDRIGDTFRWKGENVSTQEVQEIISGFPAIHMASVYGVHVPATEGRVGMAAIMLETEHPFDDAGFYRFVTGNLPPYAVPVFVRLVTTVDMTGTYKLKKTELQKSAYDPDKVPDPLYYLDRDRETYSPLTREDYERIQAGELLRF